MAKGDHDLKGGLTLRTEPRDGAMLAYLAGNVTELADFSPLLRLGNPLRIDLAGIQRINSLGVRGWAMFVRKAEEAGLQLAIERCSPVMVQQISMISNFMGHRTQVKSLLVPYFCPSCNAEDTSLVEVTPGAPLTVASTKPCPKCKAAMQIDESEGMYETLFVNQRAAAAR